MKKEFLLEEERGNLWEKTMEKESPVSRFRLSFLGSSKRRIIRKLEVRKINFQDLMRHLRRGESVLITPKLQENFSTHEKRQANRELGTRLINFSHP